MFDLRENAFYVLGVSPQATKEEIVDAYEEAIDLHPEKEQELLEKQSELLLPRKRIAAELTYLWDVPMDEWEETFASTDLSIFDELSASASINLAAHMCVSPSSNFSELHQDLLHQIVSNCHAFEELLDHINGVRAFAGIPIIQINHYHDAVDFAMKKYRKVAMSVVELSENSGMGMTKLVEDWRYDTTLSGKFVNMLTQDYDRWTISKLRPIEHRIDQIIDKLGDGQDHPDELDNLDGLLLQWDQYSQPVQLMCEAKGIDEPRSNEIYDKLRLVALSLHNEFDLTHASLRITQVLLRTFIELPGKSREISSDIEFLSNYTRRQQRNQHHQRVDQYSDFMSWIRQHPSKFEVAVETGIPTDMGDKLDETICPVLEIGSGDENLWFPIYSVSRELRDTGYLVAARFLANKLQSYTQRFDAPTLVRESTKRLLNSIYE